MRHVSQNNDIQYTKQNEICIGNNNICNTSGPKAAVRLPLFASQQKNIANVVDDARYPNAGNAVLQWYQPLHG